MTPSERAAFVAGFERAKSAALAELEDEYRRLTSTGVIANGWTFMYGPLKQRLEALAPATPPAPEASGDKATTWTASEQQLAREVGLTLPENKPASSTADTRAPSLDELEIYSSRDMAAVEAERDTLRTDLREARETLAEGCRNCETVEAERDAERDDNRINLGKAWELRTEHDKAREQVAALRARLESALAAEHEAQAHASRLDREHEEERARWDETVAVVRKRAEKSESEWNVMRSTNELLHGEMIQLRMQVTELQADREECERAGCNHEYDNHDPVSGRCCVSVDSNRGREICECSGFMRAAAEEARR